MLVYKNWMGYEQNDNFPNTDWRPPEAQQAEPVYVLDEFVDKELVQKILQFFPGYELVIVDGQIIDVLELPSIEYEATEPIRLHPNEECVITIKNPSVIEVEASGQIITVDDGTLEYSNENPGTHTLILKAPGYKMVHINVEVLDYEA